MRGGFNTTALQESAEWSKQRKPVVRESVDPVTGEPVNLMTLVTNGGIDDMYAKGHLTSLQKAAADRFLYLYEAAHSDGMKVIDYSKLRVDTSFSAKSFASNARASGELERLPDIVGEADYAVLLTVVVRGWSVRQIARELVSRRGGDESWKRELARRALIRALDALDRHWNTAVGTGAGMRAERTVPAVAASAGASHAVRATHIAILKKAGLA